MKVLKNISDELWLGVVCLIASVATYAINTGYLLISGVFAFMGIMLLVFDNLKKSQKANLAKTKKTAKKVAKK